MLLMETFSVSVDHTRYRHRHCFIHFYTVVGQKTRSWRTRRVPLKIVWRTTFAEELSEESSSVGVIEGDGAAAGEANGAASTMPAVEMKDAKLTPKLTCMFVSFSGRYKGKVL